MEFKCPICASGKHHNLYSKKVLHPLIGLSENCFTADLTYEQCLECGHICLHPIFEESVYTEYYTKVSSPSNTAFRNRSVIYEERKGFVVNTLKTSNIGKIIEVGASKGDLLKLFDGENELFGIELSEDCIEAAKDSPIKYYSHPLEETARRSPELSNSGDLVIACHVLEHTHDPKIFFNALADLVAENGHLYIEVPSVEANAQCGNPIANTLCIGHIHMFSIETLNRLAHDAGFYPIEVEVSNKHGFPALRIIYRRNNSLTSITSLFNHHATEFDHKSYQASQTLKDSLSQDSTSKHLIWGVGQDCLDLLNHFDAEELHQYRHRIVLTDLSERKQGRDISGIAVLSPADIKLDEISCILTSTRSQLIQTDIENHVQRIAPNIKFIHTYPMSP